MTFLPGQIIRHKKTGHPYLIILVPETALLVVDLTIKDDPVPLRAIMPRDKRYYARDTEFDVYTTSALYSYWSEPRNIFMLTRKIKL